MIHDITFRVIPRNRNPTKDELEWAEVLTTILKKTLQSHLNNMLDLALQTAKEQLKMPLKKDSSKKAFKENVKKEVGAGKPVKQAVAIAYSTQRNAKKKGK